jgi:hypothetical protein
VTERRDSKDNLQTVIPLLSTSTLRWAFRSEDVDGTGIENIPQRLKPQIERGMFLYGLKPVPFDQPSGSGYARVMCKPARDEDVCD